MSNNSKSTEKKTIHTTISEESSEILDKYASIEDENGEKIFGNKSKVIEKALELLDEYYTPQKGDMNTIWNRAREELNMVLVGKTTFLAYISGDHTKAFKENIAVDILEWYARMSIEDMDLMEIVESIRNVWLAANYFYKIDIEVGNKGSLQLSFYHDMHSLAYSEYWGRYFTTLLQKQKKCQVEMFPRSESLILRIN
ncbi:MAG: hypothetical protein JW891_12935 [Candidatus Lokiarchaeota archaeon]|nr:hypothetical protein [Candidatus Lokiarchaeota archaeon]